MERFDRIFSKISDRLALYSGIIVLLAMIFYVSGHVFFRYVLRIGGLEGTYSWVGTLLIPLVFLALSYGWYKRAIIVIDMFQNKLKGKVYWGFQFAFLLITLVLFSAVFTVGTFMDTVSSFIAKNTAGEQGMLTPEWPWKATIFFGFLMLTIRNLLDVIRMVRTGEVISEKR
jgi:TRAP-type mannitol/chloroaromatic compound transport system permease small subunit